jgi:hypothetical protein
MASEHGLLIVEGSHGLEMMLSIFILSREGQVLKFGVAKQARGLRERGPGWSWPWEKILDPAEKRWGGAGLGHAPDPSGQCDSFRMVGGGLHP